MADIFLKKDVVNLFKNKFVLLMGDSNMRCIYKDIIWFMSNGSITPARCFYTSLTKNSFCGDQIIDQSEICTGRDYYQIREYKNCACENFLLRYHFITRVYGKTVQMALDNIEKGITPMPQIVILNSCLWDLNRWGPSQEDTYKNNILTLFQRLRSLLPEDSLVLWTTTLPISCEQTRGGVLIQQLQFMKHSLRFMIMEANLFVKQLCVAFEYDVLDLHYHMRHQLNSRAKDGIHWEPHAMRHMSNLILTHIALSFEIPLPNLVINRYIMAAKHRALEALQGVKVDVQLDKVILDQVFGENFINVGNEKHIPGIRKLRKTSGASINSNKENIVTASADTTFTPAKESKHVQSGSISSKDLVTEGNKITSVIKIKNSSRNVETTQHVPPSSASSNNSVKSNHFITQTTVSTTDSTRSPVTFHHNNSLTTQSSYYRGTTTTVSATAVASTSKVQQTFLQEHSAVNNPDKRVIKQARRRLTKPKKEDAVIAQRSIDENIQDCILNILHSPDSTTSQILLQSIDSIAKEPSPLSRGGIIRGSYRGEIAMGIGSIGTTRGNVGRRNLFRGWGTSSGTQPHGRGFGRERTGQILEDEFCGDLNAQMYDDAECREDVDWGDRINWDDKNSRYDLGHVNYASDDMWIHENDLREDDNSSPRGNVFDRLGKQVHPQPGYNHTNFELKPMQEYEYMPHDHYHSEFQYAATYNQWGKNRQDLFHSEFQHTATHNQRGTNQRSINHNHHYIQQMNFYLQDNQQQHQSYSYSPSKENTQTFQQLQTRKGPKKRGRPLQRRHPHQRDGPQQWAGRSCNSGFMVPNDSTPFWSSYQTNNFPWNDQY